LFALATTGASAQTAPAAKEVSDTDRLIVSHVPVHRSRLHRLLAKLIGRAKKRVLGLTRSEVWHVPKARSQRLVERLAKLGIKVTKLREDWNHILKRYTHPFALSRRQKDLVAHSRAAPETVGIGLMKAPEAAVAEYALTGEGPEAASTLVL